jgi:hypothetical protein
MYLLCYSHRPINTHLFHRYSPTAGAGVVLFTPPNTWSTWTVTEDVLKGKHHELPTYLIVELIITSLNAGTDLMSMSPFHSTRYIPAGSNNAGSFNPHIFHLPPSQSRRRQGPLPCGLPAHRPFRPVHNCCYNPPRNHAFWNATNQFSPRIRLFDGIRSFHCRLRRLYSSYESSCQGRRKQGVFRIPLGLGHVWKPTQPRWELAIDALH